MTQAHIYSIGFIIIGLFPIAASIRNWDFFFENSKAQIFVDLFGRNGARIFYLILGTGLVIAGLLFLVGVIDWG